MALDWTTVVVSTLTAASAITVGRAARRSPRQERRDDFDKATARLDKDIERLEGRITRQDTQINGQSAAIAYLHNVVRALTTFARVSGLEPPQPALPPDEAKPFLHDIGV